MELVTLPDIRAAADRIGDAVVRTPLVAGPWSAAPCLLKSESLQPTGAFKLRGALNALRCLDPARRAAGVVTHSSGNHGQALAYAARGQGVGCTVVVPEGASRVKVEAMRRFGAHVVEVPPSERLAQARRLAEEEGLTLVPPFDDRAVIAGQGTVGLEIVADAPHVETVLVPVGGGGLASGVAAAVKSVRPEVAVIGVEPELAADAAESLAAGRLITWSPQRTGRTVADGVRTGMSELTFAHLSAHLDGVVTVTEAEIRAAVGLLALEARLVVEPSGALTTAAFLGGKVPTEELHPGGTVAVVSGGNVDPHLFARILERTAGAIDDLHA